jgi:hypothetical protein
MAVWVGVRAACATLVKPFYIVLLIVPVLAAGVGMQWRSAAFAAVWAIGGFALPTAPMLVALDMRDAWTIWAKSTLARSLVRTSHIRLHCLDLRYRQIVW